MITGTEQYFVLKTNRRSLCSYKKPAKRPRNNVSEKGHASSELLRRQTWNAGECRCHRRHTQAPCYVVGGQAHVHFWKVLKHLVEVCVGESEELTIICWRNYCWAFAFKPQRDLSKTLSRHNPPDTCWCTPQICDRNITGATLEEIHLGPQRALSRDHLPWHCEHTIVRHFEHTLCHEALVGTSKNVVAVESVLENAVDDTSLYFSRQRTHENFLVVGDMLIWMSELKIVQNIITKFANNPIESEKHHDGVDSSLEVRLRCVRCCPHLEDLS